MNKAYKPLRGLFFIILGVAAITIALRPRTAKDRIPWRTDFPAAVAEAHRDGKLLFLYFTAEWCPPCQEMKFTTWGERRVESALAGYVPVKVDIDQDPWTAIAHGVDPLPAFVVRDADGRILRRGDGFLDADAFVAWIERGVGATTLRAPSPTTMPSRLTFPATAPASE